MAVWKGDRGCSDLLDKEELSKDDLRFEVLGTLDEASSALGLARALVAAPYSKELILEVQQDLCGMLSELASQSPKENQSRITAEHTVRLEERMVAMDMQVQRPTTFLAVGDGVASAAIHLARTIVRRAERVVVRLDREGRLYNPEIISYLNHLSAYLYSLARYEDASSGVSSPTLLHPPGTSRVMRKEKRCGQVEKPTQEGPDSVAVGAGESVGSLRNAD